MSLHLVAEPKTLEVNLRRLRAFVVVAGCGSVSRAAGQLHVVQSAVTRAVRGLELDLGVTLFDRAPRAMLLTEPGRQVLARARRALEHLEVAERDLAAVHDGAPRRAAGLAGKVSQRHLRVLVAVAERGTETAAAQQLGVSQPAVTLALQDLEGLAGAELFRRTSRGMAPTAAGDRLAGHAGLALAELAALAQDAADGVERLQGRLVVGALSLSGTLLVPMAVSRLSRQHPGLQLSVIEGPYDTLLQGLRRGDIDVIVGALHPAPPEDVAQEWLFDDVLSVVARQGHPLAARHALALADLADADWVVPYRRAPSRNALERAMLAAGLHVPDSAIEANTVLMLRGLLSQCDRLSVLWRLQARHENGEGLLALLPVDLPGTALPMGLGTRAGAGRSASLDALLAHVRDAVVSASAPPRRPVLAA